MAHISATIIPRKTLDFRTRIEVIFPQDDRDDFRRPDKILYLLHGLTDDCTAWSRHSRIESYAEEHGYIVIMPEVHRSFYSNMKYGGQYFSYVTEELPAICEELFNIKHERSNTFIAGLSMGGYGAIKCGLTRSDLYAACAGFSGALDPVQFIEGDLGDSYRELYAIMDRADPWPDEADLFKLATKMSTLPKEKQTRVLVTCGDEDFLIEHNRKFNNHMKTLPTSDYKYTEWPGDHVWKFWEESLPVMFEFFDS